MPRLIQSFGWAMNGLRTVWKEEGNFRIEVAIGVLVLIATAFADFMLWQWILLVLTIAFVLLGEIINTVVEDVCNKIEPNQDPVIGKIKDMMAGYVLVSSVAAVAIGILLFLS